MSTPLKAAASALVLSAVATTTVAQEAVRYSTAAASYEGYLVSPAETGDMSGVAVLLAHDFLGPGENQLAIARDYAARGATALVADFYGTGIRPADTNTATIEAMRVRGDVPELRAAMKAALKTLISNGAEPEKIAVIGTSVGGLAALELGRTGEKLGAIITLWGVLENTHPQSASPIQANVTLLQGDSDPLTPLTAVDETREQLTASRVLNELVIYKDTAHAFTLPFVGTDISSGFAYNAQSAKDAFRRIESILLELAAN